MQNIGQAWLVLQLTDSAFKLGIVTALQFLPTTFFALLAGTFVDRFPKRKILLFTQISMMVLALILATLTLLDWIEYWHVLVLAVVLGLVNTLDIPARQAFVVEMVGKESLMNAIALNSTVFNLGRLVGPAVAGLLIGLLGMAICFYINALSFCAVILGLLAMKVDAYIPEKKQKDISGEIHAGLNYTRANPKIFFPFLILALFSIFSMNYNVLIPVFATEGLSQGALGFGILMTSLGTGSLLGAFVLAANSKKGPKMKVLFFSALGTAFFLVILGFENQYLLSCLTLVLVGFLNMIFVTSVNSMVQYNSSNSMRGRVMSVYALVLGGLAPLGSIFSGKAAEILGAHRSISLSGIIGILAAILVMAMYYRKKE